MRCEILLIMWVSGKVEGTMKCGINVVTAGWILRNCNRGLALRGSYF